MCSGPGGGEQGRDARAGGASTQEWDQGHLQGERGDGQVHGLRWQKAGGWMDSGGQDGTFQAEWREYRTGLIYVILCVSALLFIALRVSLNIWSP